MTKRLWGGVLLAAIAFTNLINLAILVHLTWERGWPVVVFALAGLFVSVFYVAPRLRLKQRGLGEPGRALRAVPGDDRPAGG